MKIKISKKKFYNKFDYKITLAIDGCESLRYTSIVESRDFLISNLYPRLYISDRTKLNILKNKDILLDLCSILIDSDPKDWQKRIEKGSIDIYAINETLIENIQKKLSDHVVGIFKPDVLGTEPNTLRVKKLPNDRYKYRVYLLPHKLKNDTEGKRQYLEWVKNQSSRIKITECVEKWFYKTDWNWDPRYVLVDEESTLLMLKLRNPEVVGRVYKFLTN
jgi:hypothetical protein